MRTVVDNFIEQKNKVGDSITPIYLYAIQYDKVANLWLYYTNYSADVTFSGQAYSKYVIQHSSIREALDGRVESVSLNIGNVNREMQYYLDTYNALKECQVVITLVWKEMLSDPTCFLEDVYYIESANTTPTEIELSLSSNLDVMNVELPRCIFSRTRCRFIFKDTNCGYSGSETACDKTLVRCEELVNSGRFGGFVGIPQKISLVK